MAAVHDGPSDIKSEKETKPDALSDESASNLPGIMSGTLSTSLHGSTTAPAAAPKTEEQQQTLLAVLQFLKRNKLTESVDILRREAGLQEEPEEEERGAEAAAPGLNSGCGDASSLLSRVSAQSGAPAKGGTQTLHYSVNRSLLDTYSALAVVQKLYMFIYVYTGCRESLFDD